MPMAACDPLPTSGTAALVPEMGASSRYRQRMGNRLAGKEVGQTNSKYQVFGADIPPRRQPSRLPIATAWHAARRVTLLCTFSGLPRLLHFTAP